MQQPRRMSEAVRELTFEDTLGFQILEEAHALYRILGNARDLPEADKSAFSSELTMPDGTALIIWQDDEDPEILHAKIQDPTTEKGGHKVWGDTQWTVSIKATTPYNDGKVEYVEKNGQNEVSVTSHCRRQDAVYDRINISFNPARYYSRQDWAEFRQRLHMMTVHFSKIFPAAAEVRDISDEQPVKTAVSSEIAETLSLTPQAELMQQISEAQARLATLHEAAQKGQLKINPTELSRILEGIYGIESQPVATPSAPPTPSTTSSASAPDAQPESPEPVVLTDPDIVNGRFTPAARERIKERFNLDEEELGDININIAPRIASLFNIRTGDADNDAIHELVKILLSPIEAAPASDEVVPEKAEVHEAPAEPVEPEPAPKKAPERTHSSEEIADHIIVSHLGFDPEVLLDLFQTALDAYPDVPRKIKGKDHLTHGFFQEYRGGRILIAVQVGDTDPNQHTPVHQDQLKEVLELLVQKTKERVPEPEPQASPEPEATPVSIPLEEPQAPAPEPTPSPEPPAPEPAVEEPTAAAEAPIAEAVESGPPSLRTVLDALYEAGDSGLRDQYASAGAQLQNIVSSWEKEGDRIRITLPIEIDKKTGRPGGTFNYFIMEGEPTHVTVTQRFGDQETVLSSFSFEADEFEEPPRLEITEYEVGEEVDALEAMNTLRQALGRLRQELG